MRNLTVLLLVATLCAGCASIGSGPTYHIETGPNQVSKDVRKQSAVYSIGQDSFVTVSLRREDLTRHQGNLFVIGAFNRSGRPVSFGPADVRVVDGGGRVLPLLDRARVAQIEKKRQGRKKFVSTLMATVTSAAVLYAAGDYVSDKAAAGFDTTYLQAELTNVATSLTQSAFAAADVYNRNLDKAARAQIKHFENTALRKRRIAVNQSAGGFVVVEQAPPSMTLEVSVGGERHRFRLTRR